jgi:hypothetical protein
MRPPTVTAADGLNRRQVLKRGIALGAATLWTTPTLQLIRMSSARAAETSGSVCVTYCIKWDVTNSAWEPLGKGAQACLLCPDGAMNALPPTEVLQQITISGDPDIAITVKYPVSCSLLVIDAVDELSYLATAAAKCGTGSLSCRFAGPDEQQLEDKDDDDTPDPGEFYLLTLEKCANTREISHLELLLQCCDHDTDA